MDVLVYTSNGTPASIKGVAPHTAVRDLFLAVGDHDSEVLFMSTHDRNICPSAPIHQVQSNVLIALRKIRSYGHDLIEVDPEENGSIARMTSSKESMRQR